MSATSTSALALAARLRQESDEGLAALLRARQVRDAGIRDYFDLAEKLLDPASVHTALSRLDRPTLATIAAIAQAAPSRPSADELAEKLGADVAGHLATAQSEALVDHVEHSYYLYDTVTAALAAWPAQGLPTLAELAQPAPAALVPVSRTDAAVTDAAAADQAFTTTTSIAELISSVETEPARELARGGIALPDSRRLAEAAAVALEDVPALQSIAERAGLIGLEGGLWLPTVAAVDWMLLPTADRWARLAGAWLDRLPSDIRGLLGGRAHALWGDHFEEYIAWLYPAGGEWMRERVTTHTHAATLLGIVAGQVPSTPGAALLASGVLAASEAMTPLFPREISQVYLQHDLSIVSPGPLEPRLDARLRTMATVESRALATNYRVSPASLNRALAAGETAKSITEFFAAIALTGIPQPLAYLVAESATRYGLLRVGVVGEQEESSGRVARSYIRSTDETLLRTVRVDHALAGLGLQPNASGRLTSRFDPGTVFWALNDARYPVAAENADGTIIALERGRTARQLRPTAQDTAQVIVDRLRLLAREAPGESNTDWLAHQLDVAIRAKMTVTVSVTVQDGSTVVYTVQPTSIAGGRLRGLDRVADIERTLPLTRITAIGSPD